MEDTRLIHVQVVHRERVLTGVMEIANGLMDDVKKIYFFKKLSRTYQKVNLNFGLGQRAQAQAQAQANYLSILI